MSWVKKRSHPTQPPVQMYNPNQHSNQPENQWQQQPHDNWYSQQPKNYWQQPNQQQQQQQPYNQNSQQYYQEYYQNNTAYQQQQPQPYGNLQYNQQYNAQNNLYQQQPPQQAESDGWSTNWGWGDEDNSNVQAPRPTNNLDSFTNDETWNWSLDQEGAKTTTKIENTEPEIAPKSFDHQKRNKLDTPQWSMESQMSQESSDDILQTSESDKSRMLSRSSTISHSPISGQDLAPGNQLDLQIKEESGLAGDYLHFENKEILSQHQQEVAPPLSGDDAKSSTNPYKRNTSLSHKAANKFRSSSNVTPPDRAANLFQPQNFGQTVNLETLPDNSEQPDPVVPVIPPSRKISNTNKPWPENNEAPINDRNQYLETAQLSDVDLNNFNQITETSIQDNDTLPPPGLRRMVLGRVEQQENNQAGSDDTPLPSFSRMVPGQLESAPIVVSTEPPEGLHRMIPGESSSPESSMRQQSATAEKAEEDDSGPELESINSNQQRSATIGADTPPVNNRSETIGADTSPPPSSGDNRRKKRRDSIEGDDVATAMRNLTVTETKDDDVKVSSESEREPPRVKSPRDRRYKEEPKERGERDRNRSRYSPDDYRDSKKYHHSRRYKEKRYEEDTDYYSDKERERRHHRGEERETRDYGDRKYNSLRKDKDRDRRRGERREYGGRKNDYYYEYDYENESRSRASSRSDSVHDSYRDGGGRGHDSRGGERRERRHHRDKDRHRRHRGDPFNPYAQGFGYDIYSQYYQQYHYYENLRKTNPQAYAQLYRKYYQDASGQAGDYGGEVDRASVHSGRSSANDELAKDRYTRQSYYSQTSLPHLGGYYRGSQTHSISGQYGLDDSSFVRTLDQTDHSLNYEDPQHLTAQRMTPAKFATAHTKASIASGKLVKILPHYPLDGQPATVELSTLESLLNQDEDYQELKRFPGPLVKGTTHKKTIIEYCENKIKEATHNQDIVDRDSYVLMWELLILLIRQNGMVVGADIAELLLKNRPQDAPPRPPSVVSSIGSNVDGETVANHETTTTSTNMREEEVTNKFREYLLYGSGKEALEWAMKHGLWGHALFLASKLDKRTYANVLMRFANGLAMNDPLQTLYQLLSGRTPAAVTCVADEKWGDWRPHLAMILSNSTQRPELNCKAITVLGDTLMGRGSLYAAQFCYLMAEVGFSDYGNSEAKLVLLGANHNEAFLRFATNEAIHMTEIYEYARSLNDSEFTLVSFQRYKYLLSARLADVGLLEKALSYLEKIANFILKHPGTVDAALVNQVYMLADRLKYYDPVGEGEDDENELDSSRHGSWLANLKRVQNDYDMGLISQEASYAGNVQEDQTNQVYGQQQNDVWQQQQYDHYQPQQQLYNDQPAAETMEYQKQPEQQQQQEGYLGQYQEQQYWPGQQQQWNSEQNTYQHDSVTEQQNYYGSVNAQTEPEDVEKKKSTEEMSPPRPQISLPNQREDKPRKDSVTQQEPTKPVAPSKPKPVEQSAKQTSGNGWFGGIFSKLSFKPNNQMKLPDDKNPTILWDPEKKKWVNTEDENGDGGADFKPPPKLADMIPKTQMAPQPQLSKNSVEQKPEMPVSAAQPNMFKLQKGRNLKKSYIDVFNPSKTTTGQLSSLPAPAPLQQPTQPQMNFFVPQPVNDPNAPTDFLTPAPPMQYDENAQQMSRWSSASSLSREVQSYTMHKPNPRR